MIGVILKSSTSEELYEDMTALLNYGFEAVETKKVMSAGETKSFPINGEQQPYFSDEEIWITTSKGVASELSIDSFGNLFALNSPFYKPDQPLTVLKPLNLNNAPAWNEPEVKVQTIPTVDRKSPWSIALTILWFLQIVFMFFVLLAKQRKRKQQGLKGRS
ncbi:MULTISPECIES: hypothetical protein [unclassified Cohnella]|uniref:hypothetical protein n=1 Tax=unclassified Cohnella TaxID=2636738 RepID=UPI0011806631|nr:MULTISPECIES: hypothetical protein [unclassified Cohnella]